MAPLEGRAEQVPGPIHDRWRAGWARLRPLGRRAWHPVSILAILGVAYVVLGGLHFTTGRQLEESQQRIAAARLALSRPAPQVDQLTVALRGWEFVLATARSSRVAPLVDTELVQRTLDLAASTGVALIDAGIRAEFVEEIDGRRYRAVPYVVTARGSLPRIETFLHWFESSLVDTLEIRGSIVTGDENEYVLMLSSVVYSYLPETDSVSGDETAEEPAPVAASAATGGGQP